MICTNEGDAYCDVLGDGFGDVCDYLEVAMMTTMVMMVLLL